MSHRKQSLPFLTTEGIGVVVAIILCCCTELKSEAQDKPRFSAIEVRYYWEVDPPLNPMWMPERAATRMPLLLERLDSKLATERLQFVQLASHYAESDLIDREAVLKTIIQHLKAGESHAQIRLGLIGTACQLDTQAAYVDFLWQLTADDAAGRNLVEAHCLKHATNQPLSLWRKRLTAAGTSDLELLQACHGLRQSGSKEDVPLLKSILLSRAQTNPARLAAAQAIAGLDTSAAVDLVNALSSEPNEMKALLTVSLLKNQTDEKSIAALREIALSADGTAPRTAFERLLEIDTPWVIEHLHDFAQHADSEMRRESYRRIGQIVTRESCERLLLGLSDPIPAIRQQNREALLALASQDESLQQLTQEALSKGLVDEDWRRIQQSIRLAVELDERKACSQLISLLDHPRHDVNIMAAWGLSYLARDEESLKALLARAEADSIKIEKLPESDEKLDQAFFRRAAHLLEALGRANYRPAIPLLKKYVPKNGHLMGTITRMCGMTALGRCLHGERHPDLIKELSTRIADKSSILAEPECTRYTATLTLGLLADPAAKAALLENDEAQNSPIHTATTWALSQLPN